MQQSKKILASVKSIQKEEYAIKLDLLKEWTVNLQTCCSAKDMLSKKIISKKDKFELRKETTKE